MTISQTTLPYALAGMREQFDSPAGLLSMYGRGSGRPLLLVHSVNAAASAAEVRPLYNHYSETRHAFALDLPGYGFSDRSDRPYTIRLMTDAIHAATAQIREYCGNLPIDALGVSLSCEFLVRAATEGSRFRTLALVSPTGFGAAIKSQPRELGAGESWPHKILKGPGWGRPIFRLLTQPGMIRYFLKRTWGSPRIDEQLWQYDVLSAAQPGAEHAPLYFLAGRLFSSNVLDLYQQLSQPVWMSHGTRGDFVDYRNEAFVRHLGNWRHSVFETGAMPYFECLEQFTAQYDGFMERAGGSSRPGASGPPMQRFI